LIKVAPVKKKDLINLAKFVENNTNIKFQRAKKLISCKWEKSIKNYGFMLKDNKLIVGYWGCLYSNRTINNKKIIFGNMTNWVVQKKYRQHSLKLLLALIKQKNCVITNFTANKKVSKILELFGFKKLDESEITFNFFSGFFRNFFDTKTNIEDIKNFNVLNKNFKKILEDHKKFETIPLILNYKEKKIFCLFLRRPSGKFGNVKLMYSSNYNFVIKKINIIVNFFIKKYKIFSISVDKRFIQNNNFSFFKETLRNKYFFSKINISKKNVDLLYSEFFGMYG